MPPCFRDNEVDVFSPVPYHWIGYIIHYQPNKAEQSPIQAHLQFVKGEQARASF